MPGGNTKFLKTPTTTKIAHSLLHRHPTKSINYLNTYYIKYPDITSLAVHARAATLASPIAKNSHKTPQLIRLAIRWPFSCVP
jgi:hypothetical protein